MTFTDHTVLRLLNNKKLRTREEATTTLLSLRPADGDLLIGRILGVYGRDVVGVKDYTDEGLTNKVMEVVLLSIGYPQDVIRVEGKRQSGKARLVSMWLVGLQMQEDARRWRRERCAFLVQQAKLELIAAQEKVAKLEEELAAM